MNNYRTFTKKKIMKYFSEITFFSFTCKIKNIFQKKKTWWDEMKIYVDYFIAFFTQQFLNLKSIHLINYIEIILDLFHYSSYSFSIIFWIMNFGQYYESHIIFFYWKTSHFFEYNIAEFDFLFTKSRLC